MSERYSDTRKTYFVPSTVENIDRSVYDYIKSLNLHVDTNTGFQEVPVLWGTSERSFLSKDKKEARDQQGTLKFPLISIRRTSFTKPLRSPGVFQGTVPETNDEQGGSLPVSKIIHQEKTAAFANAEALRLHGQPNFPGPNPKIVYKTISAPMPVNVELMYEITLRTEYQQQMNTLMLPFVTIPGTINYIKLQNEGHRYEGFVQDQYQSSDNLSDFSAEERKFETKITLKVIGYLVGQGKNREKPHYSVRENFVEVKLPRERIVLGESPENDQGSYFGLAGFSPGPNSPVPPAPGAGAGGGGGAQSDDAGRGGFAGAGPSSRSGITLAPTSDVPPRNPAGTGDSDGFLLRRDVGRYLATTRPTVTFKSPGVAPSDPRVFTVVGDPILENSELIFKDGILQIKVTDYTISGNVITFTSDIVTSNHLFIKYSIDFG